MKTVADGQFVTLDRRWLLAGAWLAMAGLYYFGLVLPYGLTDYLHVPGASAGVIAGRDSRAALILIGFFVAAFALHAASCFIARCAAAAHTGLAVIAGGVLLAGLLTFAYPIGANDVFNYMVQGDLLVSHRLNPMVYAPSYIADLPLLGFAAYRGQISPYGPVWTLVEALVVTLFGSGNLLALAVGFKLLAVAGYLVTCWLLYVLLRRRADGFLVPGLIIFAWNPLVLFETAANAHMDVWIGAAVLAAAVFWERRRSLPMLAAVTIAPLIKAVVAPLVPLFAVAAWREAPAGQRRSLIVGGSAVVLGLAAASYLVLPQALQATGNLLGRDELFTHSLPSLAWRGLREVMPLPQATRVAALGTMLVFALYSLRQFYNAYRIPGAVLRLAYNMLLFLLLVCMPWFQPWYLLWLIPLAAIRPRDDAPLQAAIFGLSAALSYVVYGFLWFIEPFAGNRLAIEVTAVITTFGLSWAYALWSGWAQWRRRRAT